MKRNMHAGLSGSGGLRLRMFSRDELDDIHQATIDVLERTGVFIGSEEALEIFHGAGADVDGVKRVVKLPEHMVEDCLRAAPSRFVCYGRHPKHDILLEGNRLGFTNFGEGIMLLDHQTGEYRPTTKQDVADSAILIDYLSEIDVFERSLNAGEVPQHAGPLHIAEAYLPNTTKHAFQGSDSGKCLKFLIQMCEAAAGGSEKFRARPFFTPVVCPNAPLRLGDDVCSVIVTAAQERLGVNPVSIGLSGGSTPVTLAGGLVTLNCEILACLCLAQLTRKGTPVMYGSSATCLDLRLAVAAVGSPELALINAGAAAMAQYYRLPSWVAGA